MLSILAFVYFSHLAASGSLAAPTLVYDSFNLARRAPEPSCVCNGRSIWEIVWSCLATIFACSWVAVHPNVPTPGASSKRVALTRLELMVWTVIAPEIMILWAMRQWLGARKLAKTYKEKGWTETHGHFIQMGGFMLYHGSTRIGVLSPEMLADLYRKDEVEFPTVSEEEIKDRSKGDALSKTLALGQSIWFIAQYIARPRQHLITTELELITLAFAVLNGFMYFLWLNKPLDVKIPIPVYLYDIDEATDGGDEEEQDPPQSEGTTISDRASMSRSIAGMSYFTEEDTETVRRTAGWTTKLQPLKDIALCWVIIPVTSVFTRLGDMSDATKSSRSHYIPGGALSVPTFYAFQMSNVDTRMNLLVASVVGMIFGAIHMIGWNFSFPSHAEKLLWRISSLIILGVPFAMTMEGCAKMVYDRTTGILETVSDKITDIVGIVVAYFGIPLYIAARFAILVEAVIALRQPPPGALIQVQWVKFTPHI